jgi:hypothetical protein
MNKTYPFKQYLLSILAAPALLLLGDAMFGEYKRVFPYPDDKHVVLHSSFPCILFYIFTLNKNPPECNGDQTDP